MADAGEMSVDAAVTAFLSEVDISILKDEQRRTLLSRLLTGFANVSVHRGLLPWGGDACLVSFIPLIGSLTAIFHSKLILHPFLTHRSL